MPKLVELQMVNWGSLRPDPIPLLADGVNVATGPNGAGKTCFLDGVKLLVGVDSFGAGRTPVGYVFDGGPDGIPADRAYLRATFANPVGPDRRHRVFAWAGHGCEDAPFVTVVCVVGGDRRWYSVLPGRVTWGMDGAGLADGLAEIDALPQSRRRGPRQYDQVLDQAGVTRALRGVLALPQGATDQLVSRPPTGMLRSLLELTGKQATLDEFRAQREQYENARQAHARTLERFRAEQTNLRLLEAQATRHREWTELSKRLERTIEVILPAAHFRDLDTQRGQLAEEVEQRRNAVAEDESALEGIDEQLPRLRTREGELRTQRDHSEGRRDGLFAHLGELRLGLGKLIEVDHRLTDERAASSELTAGSDEDGAAGELAAARAAVRDATRRLDRLREGQATLETEVAALREGRLLPPPDAIELRALLDAAGIPHRLVAEVVDTNGDAGGDRAAEAALGEALWGVVVEEAHYRDAIGIAVEAGIRLPVAVAGEGVPRHALAALEHPAQLGRLLAHLDIEVTEHLGEQDGVTTGGIRWSPVVARLAASPIPVLGQRARKERLLVAEAELTQVAVEAVTVEALLSESEARHARAQSVVDAFGRLPGLVAEQEAARSALDQIRTDVKATEEQYRRGDEDLRETEGQLKGVSTQIERLGERRVQIVERLDGSRRPQLVQVADRLQRLEAELGAITLTEAQASALEAGEVPSIEVVSRQHDDLEAAVADEDRFPADIRDDLILGQVEGQRQVVEDVDKLVTGRQEDLDRQQEVVNEARRRYDEHVRAVVRLLNLEFGKVCAAAGVEGELRMIAGELPAEYGVDVRVAHRPGEPRRSYRDPGHSGGQRAKIAILILLAAMGVGGSADLLIMDEHIAHLDSTNIDHIAQLMQSLKDRVQFLLATPTNAESLRLGWCDLQLAFLPRSPGEAYTPPLRLMTRLTSDDLDARFADQQLSLT